MDVILTVVSTDDFRADYFYKALSPSDFVKTDADRIAILERRIARLRRKIERLRERPNR